MKGLHLVAELYDCSCERALLSEVDALRGVCLSVCIEPGLTPVGEIFHQFIAPDGKKAGATGAVILAESHLAVHTWPELNAVTLDLYVCNFTQDNQALARSAYSRLVKAFAPGHAEHHEVKRGELKPLGPSNSPSSEQS